MAACTAALPFPNDRQQKAASKPQDGKITSDGQHPTSERGVNGHHHNTSDNSVSQKQSVQASQRTASLSDGGAAPNGHKPRRGVEDVGHDATRDVGGRYWQNGSEYKTGKLSPDTEPLNEPAAALPRIRPTSGRESPMGMAAPSPSHRSSGGSNPQSPRHLQSATHGSFRPPSVPSNANRSRHSHGGVSSPESGGLFGLLRRSQPPAAFPSVTARPSRAGAAAHIPGSGGGTAAVAGAPAARMRRATPSGAAVAAAAAATVAAARPSPGTLVRYVLAPLLLLPVGWPWLFLRFVQALVTVACWLAAAASDGLILLADILRRNRNGAEMIAGWMVGWLAWVVSRYWAGLVQLHTGAEEAISKLAQLVTPMVAAALSRSPAAARVARMISPAVAAAAKAQAAVYGAYCFVHDEIVPVALDLAERLPLVHGLLHRAVVGSGS